MPGAEGMRCELPAALLTSIRAPPLKATTPRPSSAATATAGPGGSSSPRPWISAKRPVLGRYQPGKGPEIARVVKPWLVATAEIDLVLGVDCTHHDPAAAAESSGAVRVRPTTAMA